MQEPTLITVARYSFPHEAHIAKAALDAEGIVAFVADEHTINMQWLYSNALGGVRLQVYKSDAERAATLLTQDHSDAVDEFLGEEKEETPRCSHCGSDKLVFHTLGKKPAFLVFLLLGFPLFFYRHTQKCEHCGYIAKGD